MRWPWIRKSTHKMIVDSLHHNRDFYSERSKVLMNVIAQLRKENEGLRKQAVKYYLKSFPQRMRDAVDDCVNNNLTLRKSAAKHEVKKSTLWNRINKLKIMKEEK